MAAAAAPSPSRGEKLPPRQPHTVTADQLRRVTALVRPRRSPSQLVGTALLVDPDTARRRLSLRQIAERGGTSVSAARRYARRGLLPDPMHSPTLVGSSHPGPWSASPSSAPPAR